MIFLYDFRVLSLEYAERFFELFDKLVKTCQFWALNQT